MSKLSQLRADIKKIYKAALSAVNTETIINEKIIYDKLSGKLIIVDKTYNLSEYKNIYVVGFGKASAAMAAAIEKKIYDKITAGIIITKYGHTTPTKKIKIYEAGHPIPDENGIKYTDELLKLVDRARADDLVIVLISGGGSALLVAPEKNICLKDKQEMTELLISCGADITEINVIRKFISAVKAGKLSARINPAYSIALIISDVIGDKLDTIASGATVISTQITVEKCNTIIRKYGLYDKLPPSIKKYIYATEKKNYFFDNIKKTDNHILLNNFSALQAAGVEAEKLGYNTIILSSSIDGETREIAKMHCAITEEIIARGLPVKSPACIISGGETTVTLRGNGKGGRNQEFALAAALKIKKLKNVVVSSIGTDGTDGPTDAAGAICDNETYSHALALGIQPEKYLENNDAYHFFKKLDDLIITGPTGTNVMDLRLALVF